MAAVDVILQGVRDKIHVDYIFRFFRCRIISDHVVRTLNFRNNFNLTRVFIVIYRIHLTCFQMFFRQYFLLFLSISVKGKMKIVKLHKKIASHFILANFFLNIFNWVNDFMYLFTFNKWLPLFLIFADLFD
jgi:hypothetical protein